MNRLVRVFLVFILLTFTMTMYSAKPILRWFYPLGYRDVIAEAAENLEIDPFLIAAIIQVESGYRPKVVSPKGATGLMQLMPDTALWIAEQQKLDFSMEMLTDPATNIRLGTWYIKRLIQAFPTLPAALAAYNGGQGNVRQWLDTGKWDGRLKTVNDIPFLETKNYVRRVLYTWEFYQRIYDYRWPM